MAPEPVQSAAEPHGGRTNGTYFYYEGGGQVDNLPKNLITSGQLTKVPMVMFTISERIRPLKKTDLDAREEFVTMF